MNWWFDRLRGLTVEGRITVRFDLIPTAPVLLTVKFTRGKDMALKGLIVPQLPAAAGNTRTASITLNGGPSISVDITDPTATFDCNEGDTYSLFATDSNVSGSGPASNTLTGVCSILPPPPPPPPVPGAPVLLSVSFTSA
jgi:hypothetical protein